MIFYLIGVIVVVWFLLTFVFRALAWTVSSPMLVIILAIVLIYLLLARR